MEECITKYGDKILRFKPRIARAAVGWGIDYGLPRRQAVDADIEEAADEDTEK